MMFSYSQCMKFTDKMTLGASCYNIKILNLAFKKYFLATLDSASILSWVLTVYQTNIKIKGTVQINKYKSIFAFHFHFIADLF